MRPRAYDCPDMLAAQRGGQPAWNESVHKLQALEMARGRHDFEEHAIERQRSLVLCEVGGARLAKQFRLLPAGTLRVGVIHSVNILDDGKPCRSERVSNKKRAGVGAVGRNARAGELVVMVRRKAAAYDRAGRGKMDRKLVRDGAVLDVRDSFRREQRRENVAVLTGFACGERGEGPDRETQVERDAVQVVGADARARQNEQTMLLKRSSSTIGRIASAPRSMIERPPIFTTCTQGRSLIGRPPATGRVRSASSRVWRASGEATCLAVLVRSGMTVGLSSR